MEKRIMLDQCGYLPEMKKKVTIRSAEPVGFQVYKSSGEKVYEGMADRMIENEASKETLAVGDFSPLEAEGVYMIRADKLGESDYFTISTSVYKEAYDESMEFFYLQRCGEVKAEYAGRFAHCACHTGLATIYGEDAKIDVSGGWHDAGDYGRYVGPAAMTVAQLLLAYEENGTLAEDTLASFEGETKLSPVLEEIKYELDFMLKMQREDGCLYHKVTCRSFCGFVMPEDETEELIVSPVSVTATADFAAAVAMAVKFYEPYDSDYAEKLEKAARKAYDAALALELPGGFLNPDGITTGQYEDDCDEDERYWAAAELYKSFGDERYRKDFEAIARRKIYHGYGWADMGSYGNLAYLTTSRPVDEVLKKTIMDDMVKKAENYLSAVQADAYGVCLKPDEYIWGSNLTVCNRGRMLVDAYHITKDEKYLDAAREQIHYLLGRNANGISYLTGFGTDYVRRPHHRPSAFLGVAMRGMLSGGPCQWIADEVAKDLLSNETPPAKCFLDMTGSYSTNEVTIYWNSAFIWLLAGTIGKVRE